MKRLLNLLVALSLLGLVYCVLGVVQTAMLAGAPNYSSIVAESNERFWTRVSGVCLGLSALFLLLRLRIVRRKVKGKRDS
jgi:hypothetical protein